jgi:hypothetical protein
MRDTEAVPMAKEESGIEVGLYLQVAMHAICTFTSAHEGGSGLDKGILSSSRVKQRNDHFNFDAMRVYVSI